ncbi:uncharacterized protein L201_007010 [Kwoniella dendrophila CBS 6074]|uniref:WSC domain-containing protein n=1 Tax=Kwoniella dendrophila CBS 6074 TaxID=1295534 RepID=A0AAX4K2R2_9TREE
MLRSTILLAATICVSTANAHVALWDKGMFGLNYPYKSDDPTNNNYNNNEPVIPLKLVDGRTTAQWFGHGLLDYPPKSGDFMVLPSGGTYNGEVSCNRGQTTLGNPNDKTPKYQYACKPDGGEFSGVGALHVMNTYGSTPDPQWFGGSALAIAYTSDVANLKPNDMTVISVNQNSVWERQISYQIPAGLPPCPAGGCLCSWNWIHQGGHGEGYPFEMYNVVYRCQVTGATNSKNKVQQGAVPNKCDNNPSACVKGPKVPMYLWQADGNNLPNLDTPPNYRDNWGFADGAQNDIFQVSTNPASSFNPTALPDGWSAVGCYNDNTNARALSGYTVVDAANNTIAGCTATCASKGFLFAGVEYGQECWCGNSLSSTVAPETDCNMVCAGDIWSTCGGSSRINIYKSAKAPASGKPTPVDPSTLPSGWSEVGCMVDDQSNRALNGGSSTSSTNTVNSCIASCAAKGFVYAGVEYGQECWCGSASSKLVPASSGCDVACAGDGAHVCGGSNRLNVYAVKAAFTSSAVTKTASVTSSTTKTSAAVTSSITKPITSATTKATTASITKPITSSITKPITSVTTKATTTSTTKPITSVVTKPTTSTTTVKTTTSSSVKSSTTSSAKSSTISSSAKPTLASPSPSSSAKSTLSSSSKATLNIPSSSTVPGRTSVAGRTTTSTTSAKPSTSSVTTSTSTSAAPAATTSLPAGWMSKGCYVDSSSARVLDGTVFDSKPNMTYTMCTDTCTRKGYSYAGVEFGTQCMCGNTLVKPVAVTSGCDKPCAGDSKAMCGGFNKITILQNTANVKIRREHAHRRGRPHVEVIRRRHE